MTLRCPICGSPITQKLGDIQGERRRWITFRRWNDAEMMYDEIRTWELASEPPFVYVDRVWGT